MPDTATSLPEDLRLMAEALRESAEKFPPEERQRILERRYLEFLRILLRERPSSADLAFVLAPELRRVLGLAGRAEGVTR